MPKYRVHVYYDEVIEAENSIEAEILAIQEVERRIYGMAVEDEDVADSD
jgi:hypothetical protein